MKRVITSLWFCLLVGNLSVSEVFTTEYPINEDGDYQDLLTPQYYLSEDGAEIRDEINKFIFFARMEPFQHPLESPAGVLPVFNTPVNGTFEVGKGPGKTGEHHKAVDMHLGSGGVDMEIYASHSGNVTAFYNAKKYANHLKVTKDIKDSSGNVLGKLVTLYGSLDLDLDEESGLSPSGQFVEKGELISKHLHPETVGGPHLHYEVRYYRNADVGDEEFYGFFGQDLTDSSAGSWSYGMWNPSVGYGFANPENHYNQIIKSVYNNLQNEISIYTNSFNKSIIVNMNSELGKSSSMKIININGQMMFQKKPSKEMVISTKEFSNGVYFLLLENEKGFYSKKFKINN